MTVKFRYGPRNDGHLPSDQVLVNVLNVIR